MSNGLIDRLSDPGAESVGLGGYVHKDAVRDLLRSDEARDALAEVLLAETGDMSVVFRCADAVIRVLTGEV